MRSRTRSTGSPTASAGTADDLWVYTWLEDGGHLPEHFHPIQTEYWETLEGAARVKLDGAWRDLVPADGPVTVAPNVRHELKNESGAVARMRTRVTPAGSLEEFLTESARAARDGLYNSRNLPRGIRGARWLANFALRHRDETVMTSPPPALQRLACRSPPSCCPSASDDRRAYPRTARTADVRRRPA